MKTSSATKKESAARTRRASSPSAKLRGAVKSRGTRILEGARAPARAVVGAESTQEPPRWDLRLYIAGETDRSRTAIENLRKICELYLDSE